MKRKWSDLSSTQRAALVGLGTVQLGLVAASHADLSRRDASQINGPERLWRLVTLVSFVGPIAYFLFGRRR